MAKNPKPVGTRRFQAAHKALESGRFFKSISTHRKLGHGAADALPHKAGGNGPMAGQTLQMTA